MKKILAMMVVMTMTMLTGCAEETTKEKPVEKEKIEKIAEQKLKEKKVEQPKGTISEIGGIKIQPLKEIFRKKDDVVLYFTNKNEFEVTGTATVSWNNRHGKQNETSKKITLKPGEQVVLNFENIEVNYVEFITEQKLDTGNYTMPHLHFTTIWSN